MGIIIAIRMGTIIVNRIGIIIAFRMGIIIANRGRIQNANRIGIRIATWWRPATASPAAIGGERG